MSLQFEFKTLKRLGFGGQGFVSLVEDQKSQKYYALKKMFCDKKLDTLNFALQEAQAVLQLNHEYIVTCHSFFVERTESLEDIVCIVYEYCDSGSLEDVLKKARNKKEIIPKADIFKWIQQIAIGILYSHSKHVIHRDMKPANIFLSQGNVRIGDFGFAKTMIDPKTETQTVLGTQTYSAPEIRKENSYTNKIDIWGIGTILLDLVLDKTVDFAYQYAIEPKEMLNEIEKKYDKEMRNLVEFIVHLKPEDRPTAVQIVNFMNVLLGKDDEEIIEEEENFSKGERELRDEIIQLKLKIDQLQRELDDKDEELYLHELLKLEEQELSGSIYDPSVKPKSQKGTSFFGKLGFGSTKSETTDEVSSKLIQIDTTKEPIKGPVFTRYYGVWKSKDYGEINVSLKQHNKSEKCTLEQFKKNTYYDRIYQIGLSKVLERVYGVAKLNNQYHLVCESFPNGPLPNKLLNLMTTMDLRQKLHIIFNAAQALTVLHYAQPPLVFTVLRAQNISFDEDETPKLKNTHHIKVAGSTVFNPTLPFICIPPEKRMLIEKGEKPKYDTTDEIYAFGMLMWQVLYRRPHEFEKTFPEESTYRPALSSTKDSFELEYTEILKDCWAENPEDRPHAKKLLYRIGKLRERVDPDCKMIFIP
eukprot:gene3082-5252_t